MYRPSAPQIPASANPHPASTSAHTNNSDHRAPISPLMVSQCTRNGRQTPPHTANRSRQPFSTTTSGGSNIPTSTVAPRYAPIDAPA